MISETDRSSTCSSRSVLALRRPLVPSVCVTVDVVGVHERPDLRKVLLSTLERLVERVTPADLAAAADLVLDPLLFFLISQLNQLLRSCRIGRDMGLDGHGTHYRGK
jgi:hypothetical protein